MRLPGGHVARAVLLALGIAACNSPAPAPAPAPAPEPLAPGDEHAAFERARAEHKGVMVVFTATWCAPCVELGAALTDPTVFEVVRSSFVPLMVDVTNATDHEHDIRTRYDASTLPALVFVANDGKVVGRVTTVLDPAPLADAIRAAAHRLQP